MFDPGNNPETLVSVPNDLEAAMIVSALAAHGVDASTAGDFTSGFRAEAPGMVKVIVRCADLTRAREALDVLKSESQHESANHASTASSVGVSKWLSLAILILLAIGLLQSCF